MLSKALQNLQEEKHLNLQLGKTILEKAKKEDRALTEEEKTSLEAMEKKDGEIKDRIAQQKKLDDIDAELLQNVASGRESPPGDSPGAPLKYDARKMAKEDPIRFYNGLGTILRAVASAAVPGKAPDQRLMAAADLNTSVGSEGGFLVRRDFSLALLDRAMSESQVASRCDHIPIGADADGLKAPYIDEESRATGSRWGGVRVYRVGQGNTVTRSAPKMGKWELALEKLMALMTASAESLRDATSLGAIITRAFAEEFSWVLDDEVLFGTGAGVPLGIVKSDAIVKVAKETNQAAKTVVANNIIKMRARLLARRRLGSVWFINQDVEPQLHAMGLPVGTGGYSVYLPANGLAGTPFDTLYGTPVIPIEQAETLGTLGDIIYANMMDYAIIEKDGLEAAESMHVRFEYDESMFRWVVRNNGAPKLKTVLNPAKGTNTLSSFVALDTRA
ncbi:MAG: Phage capsid family protein [Parcubacteria group bacterium GW2011_GWB1_56_8]|nr:MAG: Phage capsid family protein [Parcubacteria group bacterium GW2011_GWB1_56_8]